MLIYILARRTICGSPFRLLLFEQSICDKANYIVLIYTKLGKTSTRPPNRLGGTCVFIHNQPARRKLYLPKGFILDRDSFCPLGSSYELNKILPIKIREEIDFGPNFTLGLSAIARKASSTVESTLNSVPSPRTTTVTAFPDFMVASDSLKEVSHTVRE